MAECWRQAVPRLVARRWAAQRMLWVDCGVNGSAWKYHPG